MMSVVTSSLCARFGGPNLVGHDALLVVLGQTTDQLEKLLSLLLGGVLPAHLQSITHTKDTGY